MGVGRELNDRYMNGMSIGLMKYGTGRVGGIQDGMIRLRVIGVEDPKIGDGLDRIAIGRPI